MFRALLLTVLSLTACSSESASTDRTDATAVTDAAKVVADPECEDIAQACHLYDKGPDSGVPHRCHQLHKEVDAGVCRAMREECLAHCGGDGGVSDAAMDAADSD